MSFQNFINNSFASYCASKGLTLDSGKSAFLLRQITQIRTREFYEQLAPFKGRQFIPKATDIAIGADTFISPVWTGVGIAEFINGKGTDIPRSDVYVKEMPGKVEPIATSYGWSLQELERAAFAGVPLSAHKIRNARRAIEARIDQVLATGNTDLGIYGLLNHPSVSATAVDSAWNNVNADVALAELNNFVSQVRVNSKGLFETKRVILSERYFQYLNTTPYSAMIPDSILAVFRRNQPGIEVESWHMLDDYHGDGYDGMIAYEPTNEVLECVIPKEYEEIPPQQVGFETIINVTSSTGGVLVHHPLGISHGIVEFVKE